MKHTLILLTIFFAIGCTNENRIFQNVKIDDGNFELYFFIPDTALIDSSISESDLINGFMIDNSKIVKEIINTWEFPILEKRNPIIPLYYLETSKNNEIYISRWFNSDLTVLMGKNHHQFDKKSLFKYEEYFKPLIAYSITISRLSEARQFISILIDDNHYIPYHKEGMLNQWEEYSGVIELECKIDNLPNFANSEMEEEYLKQEFPDIGKAAIHLWDKYSSDTIATFSIITESDISKNIPGDYNIKTEWTELTDLEIIVFNTEKDELLQIANKHGIEILDIKKIDY
jgi:hypothetical protein